MKRLTNAQYSELSELLKENHIYYDAVRRGFVSNTDPAELLKTLGFRDVIRANDGVEILLDKLSKGIKETFVSEESYKKFLDFHTDFYQYSARNSLLLFLQNPDARYVASYADWSKRVLLDGSRVHIKKNEKGMQLLIPIIADCFNDEKGDRCTVASASPEQKRLIATGIIKTFNEVVGYKGNYVFDVHQTTCSIDEISTLMSQQLMSDEGDLEDALTKMANERGYSIRSGFTGNLSGYVDMEKKDILITNDLYKKPKAKALIHVLADIVLRKKYYEHIGEFSHGKTFEASSVAHIVSRYFGLDAIHTPHPHFRANCGDLSPEELLVRCSKIQRAAQVLINEIAVKMQLDRDFIIDLGKELPVSLNIAQEKEPKSPSLELELE